MLEAFRQKGARRRVAAGREEVEQECAGWIA
jgi:hypothetical protein